MNAQQPIKIAFLSDHFLPKKDGVSTRLEYMIPILERRNHKIQCFFPASKQGQSNVSQINAYGVRSMSIGNFRQAPIAFFSIRTLKALHKWQPDIIHTIFNYSFFPIAATLYKKIMHVPLVYGYHTDFAAYAKARLGQWFPTFLLHQIALQFLNQGDVCLFPSQTIQDHMGLQKHVITGILPAGVDLEIFHPDKFCLDFRKRFVGEKRQEKMIVYVGRLAKEKNIASLRPLVDLPGVVLLLVGTGSEERRLRNLFANTPTHFLGALEAKDLAQVYASSDLLILPSKTETLGMVMLEAMACGCPVIGANAGAIPSFLSQLSQGAQTCDPDNQKEIIAAVQNMLHNADDSTRHYLRQYSSNYSWDSAVDCLLSFYGRVLKCQL